MTHDFFASKASGYEQEKQRVDNVNTISSAVKQYVVLDPKMQLLDFGSGTGLLLEQIAPYVQAITAVDVSAAMNAQLEQKRARIKCKLYIHPHDIGQHAPIRKFDGVISSMTLHHVDDTAGLLQTLYQQLLPGGFIALADLLPEDDSFHTEDTGVFHQGFEPQNLQQLAHN